MRIVKEEIFGPVVVVAKFKDEADIIAMANDTMYGLASAGTSLPRLSLSLSLTLPPPPVFSRDISRALRTAHLLKAGTVWVNCYNQLNSQVPFGVRPFLPLPYRLKLTTWCCRDTSSPESDASWESTPSTTTLRSSRFTPTSRSETPCKSFRTRLGCEFL